MAFDPIQEDCLRLILETMRRNRIYPLENAEAIQEGMDRYRADPDSLIKTDVDRSFHLVARAAELADYRVPFLTDEAEVNKEDDRAEALLREAVELDPKNWDAQRMLTALCAASNDEYVCYLTETKAKVEEDAVALVKHAEDPYELEFSRDLGRRPYLRWLAALASRALIAGQYRLSFDTACDCLDLDPQDLAGARLTAVLAMAKLEYPAQDIIRFRQDHALAFHGAQPFARRGERTETMRQDAWSVLAQMAAYYHDFDFENADRMLRLLMHTYPGAAQPLMFQPEFPDGIFSRVNVMPASQDELILAISEATPLLQEGLGAPDCACLSSWLANHELVQKQWEHEGASTQQTTGRYRSGGDN